MTTQTCHPTPRKPLVSIITPVFNVGPILTGAIESVRSQSYENWELILVDDGGTDGSGSLARRFAATHPPRITCVERPGQVSISASRNR